MKKALFIWIQAYNIPFSRTNKKPWFCAYLRGKSVFYTVYFYLIGGLFFSVYYTIETVCTMRINTAVKYFYLTVDSVSTRWLWVLIIVSTLSRWVLILIVGTRWRWVLTVSPFAETWKWTNVHPFRNRTRVRNRRQPERVQSQHYQNPHPQPHKIITKPHTPRSTKIVSRPKNSAQESRKYHFAPPVLATTNQKVQGEDKTKYINTPKNCREKRCENAQKQRRNEEK